VLPIAHNAGVFWRRRNLKKFPGVVDLVVGEHIEPADRSAGEITRLAEQWIEATVAALPLERGEPAGKQVESGAEPR
jgi:1-acyl-sn-glycerol-3-phosphate acyltransferase